MIRKVSIFVALGAISLAQVGGCYLEYHDDDRDDIRMTIVNNHHDDVIIHVEDDFWGWIYVEHLYVGESEVVWFHHDHEGDDLRARDDGDTVRRSEVRDGATWRIGP